MSLTAEERRDALNYAQNGAQFMFVSTPELINKIINGDPNTLDINDDLKIFIIERKPIRIDKNMVIKYCKGKLNDKNAWLLDQGHIKVVPRQFELVEEK